MFININRHGTCGQVWAKSNTRIVGFSEWGEGGIESLTYKFRPYVCCGYEKHVTDTEAISGWFFLGGWGDDCMGEEKGR